ncbi:unnamed protein product [Linum tenue]|uniref:Uncharacterized protein n=1 Tax=Linum tenue TaxID=586396 RepID=A0AAV0NWV0_9ROSI|nr:unnamed protein product [Linum tenue]
MNQRPLLPCRRAACPPPRPFGHWSSRPATRALPRLFPRRGELELIPSSSRRRHQQQLRHRALSPGVSGGLRRIPAPLLHHLQALSPFPRYTPPPRQFKVTDQSVDGKIVYRSWTIEDSHKVTDRDSPIPEVPPRFQAVSVLARFHRVITGQVGPTMRSRTIEMTSPAPSPSQQPAQIQHQLYHLRAGSKEDSSPATGLIFTTTEAELFFSTCTIHDTTSYYPSCKQEEG